MRIHLVRIERFRGIKFLEWKLAGTMLCLIGPGDSGKTTILDAIEAALSSRWSLSLTDDDFFQADTSQPIVISVTVGGVPAPLLSVERFGLDLQGWSSSGELHDEPADDDEEVLTVRLTVEYGWSEVVDPDLDLSPSWTTRSIKVKQCFCGMPILYGVGKKGDILTHNEREPVYCHQCRSGVPDEELHSCGRCGGHGTVLREGSWCEDCKGYMNYVMSRD